MRFRDLASLLLASIMASGAQAGAVLAQESGSRPPRIISCALSPYHAPPRSHYSKLDIASDGEAASIVIAPDVTQIDIPRDRWERWRAVITETAHYWTFAPVDANRPVLILMKRLDHPGVALGVLEPPLWGERHINCWFRSEG